MDGRAHPPPSMQGECHDHTEIGCDADPGGPVGHLLEQRDLDTRKLSNTF